MATRPEHARILPTGARLLPRKPFGSPALANKALQVRVVELPGVGGVRHPATYAFEGRLPISEATGTRTRAGFCKPDGGKVMRGSGEASRGGAEAKGCDME